MKRIYVDDGPGENVRFLQIERQRHCGLTLFERRWEELRTSRQLGLLLLAVLALTALTEGVIS